MSKLTHYRAPVQGLFCAALTVIFLLGYRIETVRKRLGRSPWALLKTEDYLKDAFELRGRKTPPNPDLVFIGIDDASISLGGASPEEIDASPALKAMQAGWPWNRGVYGMILDRLAGAGAKAVIFDLLFLTPGPGDEALKASLDRWGDRVVLASNFDFDPSQGDLRSAPSLPTESLVPTDAPHKARVGYVNYFPDTDGVIRRTLCQLVAEDFSNGAFDQNSKVQDSLAAAALRQIGRPDLIPGQIPVPFRYSGPAGTFRSHPAYELFIPDLWKGNYANGARFKDKIVIVGPSGGFHQDSHRTPVDNAMPGPEIHLNVLNALLHKEFLTETSLTTDSLLIMLAGLGAWIISATIRQPASRFVVLGAVSAGAMALLWFLYNRFGFFTTMATPLLLLNGAGGVCMVYDFVLERMEKGRFRRTLERYVSKNVVKEILDNPQSYINTQDGMWRPVALLFTDLRGFTSMTEAAGDSTQFVAQLNEYFTEMVKPVFANDGTLDKFIGDAIMAVWGNVYTRSPAHDVEMAVKTALEMRQGLARLNEKWRANGVREFAMGIGINHGMGLAGNIGSPEKMDITVLGDSVNLASRIEGLTKKYHLDLLVGENAAMHVRDLFYLQTVDLVQAVGKTKAVRVFAVHGPRSAPLAAPLPAYLEHFEKGIAAYEQRRFDDGLAQFEECLQLKPDDYLAEMYRKRCAQLSQLAPDESWNGVFVMTDK